jgi:hypothetical protein
MRGRNQEHREQRAGTLPALHRQPFCLFFMKNRELISYYFLHIFVGSGFRQFNILNFGIHISQETFEVIGTFIRVGTPDL